jgi:hypothetical protein
MDDSAQAMTRYGFSLYCVVFRVCGRVLNMAGHPPSQWIAFLGLLVPVFLEMQ